jgi:hypothetical protein
MLLEDWTFHASVEPWEAAVAGRWTRLCSPGYLLNKYLFNYIESKAR